jgi:hypothetical protein
MIKIFLCILILPFNIYADSWEKVGAWQPTPFKIKFSETLKIDSFYLKRTVPSPKEGVLIEKDDLDLIITNFQRYEKDFKTLLIDQRLICDNLINECNINCLKINEDLIKDKIKINKKLENKKLEIEKLKTKNTIIITISSIIVTALTFTTIYVAL